jgi:lipoprotein-releasing system permease protein
MTALRFSKKVALRYMWSKRAEAFITIITIISILGVAIGVMVLNMVMSIMTGFERELKDRITSANSHIVVRAFGGKLGNWENVASGILQIGGVVSVSPFIESQGLLRTRDRSLGVFVRGLKVGTASADQIAKYLGEGRSSEGLFDSQEVPVSTTEGDSELVKLPSLIVGRQLALSLGLFRGMVVSVLAPQVGSSPFGLVPRFRRFVVGGIYSSGLVEFESGLAYTGLEEAQRFFEMGRDVTGLEVRVTDLDRAPQITEQIMKEVGGLSSGMYARDWTQTNKPLWDAMHLEKNVYFIVLLLIVIMASFSIITTLIMLVLEKRRDIAVLRTLGASARGIWFIFFIQGSVIGALGTGLGLIAGYLGCVGLREYGFPLDERVFQMSTVPVQIEPLNFVLVGLCAFVICCLSTIYPALRASHLEPCDILRYE